MPPLTQTHKNMLSVITSIEAAAAPPSLLAVLCILNAMKAAAPPEMVEFKDEEDEDYRYNYENVIEVIKQNNGELPCPFCGKLCEKSRYVVHSKIDWSASPALRYRCAADIRDHTYIFSWPQ